MDQSQQATNNNQIINDFNVTTKVDPSTLSQSQISSDLDALKAAEEMTTGKTSHVSSTTLSSSLSKPKVVINKNQPQELQALQLKNPFRGE